MVGRKRKKNRSRNVLGNHQRSWIWGRHAVLESLRGGRWKPLEMMYAPDQLESQVTAEIEQLARGQSIPLVPCESEHLEQAVHARDHQGLAAKMPEYPYLSLASLLSDLPDAPFLLILDRIQDPFNFGSILRSADLFGVDGIIIGSRHQAGVSSHVARSSVGAVNYLNICQVESIYEAIDDIVAVGVDLIAASEKSDRSLNQVNFRQSVALIVGNEGEGVDSELLSRCSALCAIPQTGHVDSLNAAVAAGIFCYEVQRQRESGNSAEECAG